MTHKISGFYSLHLNPILLGVLDSVGFTEPTPIQQKAIPKALRGGDLIGLAQTGTGKTLAFALPMVQRIKSRGGRGLVLVPTRELAFQVAENFEKLLSAAGLKSAVIIGGASGSVQYKQLKENPDIIIATPGRLIEHIGQKNTDLSDVEIFVLDEADRMFDMGFLPQVERIIRQLPEDRQTMLFSATMPEEISALVRKYMRNPSRIEVSPQGTAPELVKQELYIVERGKKTELLGKLLDTYWGSVLLFVRTRYNAKKIAKLIRSFPHSVAELHSNRSMAQRKEALEGFKSGKYRILVATDIAARGIDVTGIELVINYDLPDEPENYVHRIGRTGRAGHPGHSITFAAPDQEFEIRAIEKIVRKRLSVIDLPDFTAEKFVKGTEPRPKGEKRLPRSEMAGSENDPVKKPRNIFAARRKEAALKKAKKAAEAMARKSCDKGHENVLAAAAPDNAEIGFIEPSPEFAFENDKSMNDSALKPLSSANSMWGEEEIKAGVEKLKGSGRKKGAKKKQKTSSSGKNVKSGKNARSEAKAEKISKPKTVRKSADRKKIVGKKTVIKTAENKLSVRKTAIKKNLIKAERKSALNSDKVSGDKELRAGAENVNSRTDDRFYDRSLEKSSFGKNKKRKARKGGGKFSRGRKIKNGYIESLADRHLKELDSWDSGNYSKIENDDFILSRKEKDFKRKIAEKKHASLKTNSRMGRPSRLRKRDNGGNYETSKPAFDKDYKPPRRSLIMESAYFDDDTPERRYYDRRRHKPEQRRHGHALENVGHSHKNRNGGHRVLYARSGHAATARKPVRRGHRKSGFRR